MKNNNKFRQNPNKDNIDETFREVLDNDNDDDASFPVRVHHISHDSKRNQLIHPHWHKEIEILYIESGTMQVIIEEAMLDLSGGDFVVIPSKYMHSAINSYGVNCDFYAVVFDIDFVSSRGNDLIQRSYINPVIEKPSLIAYKSSGEEFTVMIKDIIRRYKAKDSGFELWIKSYLTMFFAVLHTTGQANRYMATESMPNKSESSHACRSIVSYIEKNFTQKIRLEDISDHVGFNKEYFCRFFKRYFGVSFSVYLSQYRAKKAEYYLLHTNKKIIDISIEVGYDDPNYFSSVFRKVTGVSPSEYRRSRA